MKLKRLVIQGFKSFKDKTTIYFDDGITGVVGPNGCGKSNIVDALFWVMGEQSAKHLRGSSMKDVIFSGSSKYNPSVWAEVSLILENDEGKHIHIGQKVSCPSEIQITRKLYRNSETEYRINKVPCRLKDIQEVFMDTGAGAKSYSIIAQGEIERLVQSKPQDRRMIIEDVAGITKFKMRKKESLRKIDQTEHNLHRLEDLKMEIEKNLYILKSQSEKAEKAKSLRERIKKNELLTDSHKVYDILKELKNGKSSLSEKELELENNRVEKNSLELSLEKERHDRDEFSEKIERVQINYNVLSKELAGDEAKLNFCKDSKIEKDKLIDTRMREVEELLKEVDEETLHLEELKKESAKLEEEAEQDHDFSELEERVEYLREELELKEDQSKELKSEIDQISKNVIEIDQEIYKNRSRKEELASSIQDLSIEIESLEEQYSSSSSDITKLRDEVISFEKETHLLNKKEVQEKANIDELKSKLSLLEQQYQDKLKITLQLESNLNSLKELNESLEGVNEGSANFLKSDKSENFQLFGNLIKCDSKYAKAVQSAMGNLLDILVSKNESLSELVEWHRSNDIHGVSYLSPVSNMQIVSDETSERLAFNIGCKEEKVISLSDIVELPDDHSNFRSVLSGVYIIEDLNEFDYEKIQTSINFKLVVSLDGKVVISNDKGCKVLQIVTSSDSSLGIVARNNKILELGELYKSNKSDLNNIFENINEQKVILKSLEVEHEETRNCLADMKAQFAAKKASFDTKTSNFETGNTRLSILKNRKSETSKQRLELLEIEEKLDRSLSDYKEKVDEKNETYQVIIDEYEDVKDSFQNQKEEFVTKQIEARSVNERLSVSVSRVEDIKKRLNKNEEKLTTNRNLIEEYRVESDTLDSDIELLNEGNQKKATDLAYQERVLKDVKDQMQDLVSGMNDRENHVRKLQKNISSLEKKIIEQEIRLEQYVQDEEFVVKNMFEKYQINLRYVVGSYLEYEPDHYQNLNDISSIFTIETENGLKEIEVNEFEFIKKGFKEVREVSSRLHGLKTDLHQLGEINWQAIEDYRRQKLRFEFLKEQEIELKQSLEDLKEAILHIDSKSKVRFKSAFEEVNERFQKVFPIIFGGGSAILKINGDINDAECGIDIIAQPPGKKMQNINLMSGGEKAMTAVSLIFSIFLVKPSPFCLLDEVDAPLDDANVGRFNELLREMSRDSQFILITHNKRTMEMNDTLYGVTMEEPGISKAVSVQLQ